MPLGSLASIEYMTASMRRPRLGTLRASGRTWDNSGVTEDVATGSAAGPAAGYLLSLGLRSAGETFQVHQGRFVGRPSRIEVCSDATSLRVGERLCTTPTPSEKLTEPWTSSLSANGGFRDGGIPCIPCPTGVGTKVSSGPPGRVRR